MATWTAFPYSSYRPSSTAAGERPDPDASSSIVCPGDSVSPGSEWVTSTRSHIQGITPYQPAARSRSAFERVTGSDSSRRASSRPATVSQVGKYWAMEDADASYG